MTAGRAIARIKEVLLMVVVRRGKADALLHRSDQAMHCKSTQARPLVADHHITSAASRSGTAWDTAAMQSIFSSLKTERTAREVYRSRHAAHSDIIDDIKRVDNPKRRHSLLG